MLASVWGRNCHRLCGRKEAVFRAFFGCSGVVGFNVATLSRLVREKVRPAHEKWPEIGVLWRAGRVFSRKCRWRGCAGRIISRKRGWRGCAGRVFSRKRGWRGCAGRVVSRISSRVILLGELCRAAALVVGPLPAVLTLQCAAKPYGWHGGQPAQPTTHRVNVRIGGLTCALAG